jgi:hypothetical protein
MQNQQKSTFEEKVRSMTAKEIIMAMVEGLVRPPTINVDMGTFGETRKPKHLLGFLMKPICYGCAATNTICKIAGIKFTTSNIGEAYTRAAAINAETQFLLRFERAIDALRSGEIFTYNSYARQIEIATIEQQPDFDLPRLHNDYRNRDLVAYRKLAELQKPKVAEMHSV